MRRARISLSLPLAALLLAVISIPSLAAEPAAANRRVLLLLGNGYNVGEFHATYFALRAAGYDVQAAGPVKAGEKIEAGSKDRGLDFPADLSLEEVKPEAYFALAIPGGGSPANLEKFPRSIAIVKAFADAKKPVAAICHGPRLLVRAGVMKDRVATCLWKVKDELPDEFAAGGFGQYRDEPVVVDKELVTSRYPNDAGIFAATMLKNFEKFGGLPYPKADATALVIVPGLDPKNRQEKWLYTGALEIVRVKSTLVGSVDEALKLDGLREFAVVATVQEHHPEASAPDTWKAMQEKLKGSNVSLLALVTEGDKWHTAGSALQNIAQKAHRQDKPTAAETVATPRPPVDLAAALKPLAGQSGPYTAAIVVGPGFDEQAVVAVAGFLTSHGYKAALIGETKDALRGLAGQTLTPTATVEAPPALADKPLLIAPGGLWPESKNDAGRKARMAFLADRYQKGATLAVIGFDSYYLAKEGGLKNVEKMRFAGSDQTVWSFGKEMGGYSGDKATRSADRLYTAKPSGVEDLLKMLENK